ncbi:hypothetical protein LTR66_013390, partial [Elasticomyces elasticus]
MAYNSYGGNYGQGGNPYDNRMASFDGPPTYHSAPDVEMQPLTQPQAYGYSPAGSTYGNSGAVQRNPNAILDDCRE